MKIKCLVVDDEPLAVRLIENHIAKIDALEVVATANSALKAFEILNTQEVDLLFLDIKMPNITGIDFLKSLKNPPKTIFTTAYRDFAIESYELEVVDYLLKPITFERFFKSVDRFLRESVPIKKSVVEKQPEENYILLKSAGKNYKIDLDDIVYVESIKDYIKVHKQDGTNLTSKYKIGNLESELPFGSFIRIHRSFIINTSKITAFSNTDIEVSGIELPIGVSHKEEVDLFLEKIKK
ncbi:LytTR family DNA-binding domain-containing protein [Flavobacterium amniphilum]|uniref:LytR/AlgR family response regulator transcription factor n=1 Tax=Flavobacterium amniphilum TaxID=1834035 RepID=UPI002029B791|nr:LytTR family DNA-binding domain-containing protein [Flavobacterium amniphilum]MCL9806873.1 LytTR family DNA-binding domain-containing protein [Flavobacterium amniphilum]